MTDESALKDIVDALGERIFSLEGLQSPTLIHLHVDVKASCVNPGRLCVWSGTSSQGRGFGLQMAQAGFSSHIVKVSSLYLP